MSPSAPPPRHLARAQQIDALKVYGLRQIAIAKSLGISPQAVSHIKSLSALSGALKEVYDSGRIRDVTVAHGFSLLLKKYPETTSDYLRASRGILTRRDLAYLQDQTRKAAGEQPTFGRAGSVYVLTLPAHPGIVKIGRTAKGGQGRADELSNRRNPLHVLRHEIEVADPPSVELMVRSFLRPFRCGPIGGETLTSSKGTEYFRVDIENVVQLLDLARAFAASAPATAGAAAV